MNSNQSAAIETACKATHLYPETLEQFQSYCEESGELVSFLEPIRFTDYNFMIHTVNDKTGAVTCWLLNDEGCKELI